VDLAGQITCTSGTPQGFLAVLSRRLALAPTDEGSFSLLGVRSAWQDPAQLLPGDLTAPIDALGNFHFANLAPNTTYALTIVAVDGTVVVRQAVTTPAAGSLRFVRAVNCLPPLPPPPPIVLPPPPPPVIPVPPPPVAPAAVAAPVLPGVPIIPETDSLSLLVGGLAALGALAGWRYTRRREN
jgi:MYXO-CTERM domain-containing protein